MAPPPIDEENEVPPNDHGGTDGMPAEGEAPPQDETTSAKESASATRTILFAAGEKAVKTKEILITQIRLEFNLKHDEQKFNPRSKHVKLLQIMKSIDPTLIIKSGIDGTLWTVPNKIPTLD